MKKERRLARTQNLGQKTEGQKDWRRLSFGAMPKNCCPRFAGVVEQEGGAKGGNRVEK